MILLLEFVQTLVQCLLFVVKVCVYRKGIEASIAVIKM